MKKFVTIIASLALLACSAFVNAQTVTSGSGVSKTVYVDKDIPRTATITCTHHAWLTGAERITGWDHTKDPISINVTNDELNAHGYYNAIPPVPYHWPTFMTDSPWWFNWFMLCVLLGIAGVIFVGLRRWYTSPRRPVAPACTTGGDTHHHYHGPAPVPIDFGHKEPSFDEDDVVKIMTQMQKSESGGKFYYRHGHEVMAFKTGKPVEGANAPAAPAPATQPPAQGAEEVKK